MLGVTHEEAVATLRSVGDELIAMICDGFDPALMADETASMARNESVSSIDKDFEFPLPSKRVRTRKNRCVFLNFSSLQIERLRIFVSNID